MKLKRIFALLITGALVFGLTGCLGNAYEDVAVIDGTKISSGLYLMAQYNAYNEAKYKEGVDPEKNLWSQKVEGKNAVDWVRQRTEEILRRFVYVRRMCREKGITIDETSQQNLDQLNQYWPYLEDMYKQNGIAQTTAYRLMSTDELSRQLFEAMYAEGGELAVPDSELKTEYGEKFAHLQIISVPLNSSVDGEDVRDEVLAAVDGLLEQLRGGKTMEEIAGKDLAKVYEILQRPYDPETGADSIFDSHIAYQPANYDTYSEEFLASLKEQKVGDYGSYVMGATVMLYKVIPTFSDNEEFEATKATVLEQLKKDDYEEYIKGIYNAYNVEWTFGARAYFSPKKIKA